jgi:Ca2+-binding EF-hand superfamily protein
MNCVLMLHFDVHASPAWLTLVHSSRDHWAFERGVSVMKKIAGLLVATTHLGFASHALAESPGKGHQSAKRASAAAGAGAQSKRVEALGGVRPKDGGEPRPGSLFSYADRDADGSVSFGEFAGVVHESIARRVAKRFRQLDRNHDGRCTRAEVNKMIQARFLRFDLNRDGYFTASELAVVMKRELAAHLEQTYARLDVNRDGRFSLAELTPARKPAAPAAGASKPSEVASRAVRSVY